VRQRGGRGSGEGKEGEVSGVGGDGGTCLVGGRARERGRLHREPSMQGDATDKR
jgi:hypothetical protein